MAKIERDIIGSTNKRGFVGFPTLYNFQLTDSTLGQLQEYFTGTIPEQLVVTDLLGSSLSWFSKQKPLTVG